MDCTKLELRQTMLFVEFVMEKTMQDKQTQPESEKYLESTEARPRKRRLTKAQPNLPRTEGFVEEIEDEEAPIKRPKSTALHRKWQREWLKPQFTLSRKEAYDIFFKYLRSSQGKNALMDIVKQGSPGVAKLSDNALGKYLEQTNLLSRYPHDVIIRG